MRHIILAAALLPVHAYAWGTAPATPSVPVSPTPAAVVPASVTSGPASSSSNSGANAGSQSAAQSRSSSSSHVTVNNSSGSSGGGSGDRRAPDVIGAPLVGANNCSVGVTLGGSGPSAGGLFGLLWESGDCARNRDATLLVNMGRPGAAVELLCDSMAIRQAMARNGTPCEVDRQRWLAAGWKP